MGKNNHDELMAEARTLTAESPWDTIRRVATGMSSEAFSLQGALASQLRGRASRRRRTLVPATAGSGSAQGLAEEVRTGSIEPTDTRLKGLDRLAAKLRAAEIEYDRLMALLVEVRRRLDAIQFVRVVGETSKTVCELWQSHFGFVLVRFDWTELPAVDYIIDGYWLTRLYASDEAGTYAEFRSLMSYDGRGPLDRLETKEAIVRLPINSGSPATS